MFSNELINFNTGGYIRVTIGSTCQRITSREECEEAAAQLGLSDTEASEEYVSDWPPYCYIYEGDSLYYNTNGNATSQCNTIKRVCICKEGRATFDGVIIRFGSSSK